jgi:hypothetical protein
MMTNVENIHRGGQYIPNGCTQGPVVIVGGVEQEYPKWSRRRKSFVKIEDKLMNISGTRLASRTGLMI